MNAPIARLFGVVILLFTLLVVWTSRWTVIDSKALQNNTLNARTLIDEEKIDRGRILADNGDVLAKSVPAPGGTFTRKYPTGSLFAQAVGYSIVSEGEAAGLELSAGAYLRGVPPARGPEGEFPGGAGDRHYRGAGLGRDPDPALARVGGDVVADQFHSDRGLAQDDPGHSQPPPQGLRQRRGDLPLRPARAAAPDVLVMDEELHEVGPLIHTRHPER